MKTRLEKLDVSEIEQLRNVYNYRFVRALAQSTGKWNLVLGALTVWLGLSGLGLNTVHLFQLIIGILTVGASIWLWAKPSVRGIGAFSAVFLIAGVWNLFLVIRDNFQGLSFLVGLLGLAQLWWAYQYNRIYRIHSAALPTQPSPDANQFYNEIWQAINQTTLERDSDFIQFQIGSNRWQGWLLGNLVILGAKKQQIVQLIRESNFAFSPHVNKLGKKKRFYIGVKFDERSAQGFISRLSFDRYAEWKLRNNPTHSSEELQLMGSGKPNWLPFPYMHPVFRIPLLIIFGIILFYVVVLVITVIQYT